MPVSEYELESVVHEMRKLYSKLTGHYSDREEMSQGYMKLNKKQIWIQKSICELGDLIHTAPVPVSQEPF